MFIPADKYIKIDSINTCYWAEGEGSPVVLLHGMGGSAAGWLPSLGAFESQHRIYAPDLIGHGRTAKLDSDSGGFSDLVKFVHDFMTELKIDRAHIVGHSMGGAIALRFAMDHPERIGKMVLASSGGLGREITPLFRIMSIPVIGEILAALNATSDVKKFGDNVRKGSKNPAKITDELIEILFRIEQKPGQYKTTLKFLREGVNFLGQRPGYIGPILQGLPSLDLPILLIWGRQDDLVPFAHGEFAVKKLPTARLEVLDACGHVPMFDQPEIFNRLVLEFLKD